MHEEQNYKVICLGGPTGCGKSQAAIEIARVFNCEIINADSRQVYADFPIITAQPNKAQIQEVWHHLYGFLPTDAKFSAGDWQRRVLTLCKEIISRDRIPLLVGGTGFYFNSLLEGLAQIPPIPSDISEDLIGFLHTKGIKFLYAQLSEIDPVFALKIHPNDKQRILRGLEVYSATGRPLSWWHENATQKSLASGPLLVMKENLENLVAGLEKRISLMLELGAIQEAQTALLKCDNASAPGWTGIGCAELFLHLQGRYDLEECRRIWLANTRAYAKRQLTWFRGRKNSIWVEPDNLKAILKEVERAGFTPR